MMFGEEKKKRKERKGRIEKREKAMFLLPLS